MNDIEGSIQYSVLCLLIYFISIHIGWTELLTSNIDMLLKIPAEV